MATLNSLKLYYDHASQPSRAVWMFLKVNDIPFTPVIINLLQDQTQTEEFGRVNPYRKIPVINDNGFILTESVAILQYLCGTRKVPSYWYPQEPQERAKVDEYLNWHHTNTRLHATQLFILQAVDGRLKKKPVDPSRLERFQESLDKTLDLIENTFLKNQKFLCGDSITIADLIAFCELTQFEMIGRELGEERPKIGAWMARVKAHCGDHFTDVQKAVYKYRELLMRASQM